jgi:hypothetical protein
MPLDMLKRKRAQKRRGGRQISSDYQNESFLLFTGAAIALQNENGACSYSEVFTGEKQGMAGFVYHKVSESLFKRLAESKFPPQLLAVAVSDLIPLDYIHRGGSGSANAEHLKAKAARIVRDGLDSGMTKTQIDNFNRRMKKEWDKLQDHAAGRVGERSYSPAVHDFENRRDGIDFFEMDKRNAWLDEGEAEAIARLENEDDSETISKNRIEGTRVHQIDFRGGLKISRRMACYWRKTRADEYYACVAFLAKLLTARPPSAPSFEKRTVLARVQSAIFKAKLGNKEWSIRNRARLAEKNKDKVRIERQPNYKDRFGD